VGQFRKLEEGKSSRFLMKAEVCCNQESCIFGHQSAWSIADSESELSEKWKNGPNVIDGNA
jgi:hypothetical protein